MQIPSSPSLYVALVSALCGVHICDLIIPWLKIVCSLGFLIELKVIGLYTQLECSLNWKMSVLWSIIEFRIYAVPPKTPTYSYIANIWSSTISRRLWKTCIRISRVYCYSTLFHEQFTRVLSYLFLRAFYGSILSIGHKHGINSTPLPNGCTRTVDGIVTPLRRYFFSGGHFGGQKKKHTHTQSAKGVVQVARHATTPLKLQNYSLYSIYYMLALNALFWWFRFICGAL